MTGLSVWTLIDDYLIETAIKLGEDESYENVIYLNEIKEKIEEKLAALEAKAKRYDIIMDSPAEFFKEVGHKYVLPARKAGQLKGLHHDMEIVDEAGKIDVLDDTPQDAPDGSHKHGQRD